MADLNDRQSVMTAADEEAAQERKSAQLEMLKKIDEKWTDAEAGAKDNQRIWKENIAFFEGIQYVRSREGVSLNVQGAGKGRVRLVDNRTADHARRLHARLDQVRYAPVVVAESGDQGDRQSAKLAHAALRWFERRKHVAREKRKANWWIVLCGSVYLEPYFDAQGGPEELAPELDENDELVREDTVGDDGKPVYETDQAGNVVPGLDGMPKIKQRPKLTMKRIGDVDFAVRSPFQVYRDPRFQEWDKLRYVFVEEIADRDEVVERFRDVEDIDNRIPKGGDKIQPAPWIPDLAPETSDTTGVPKAMPTVGGIVKIRRFYERPSEEHKNGRHVIYTGQVVLWEGELPDGDFPIIQLGYMIRPWMLEGKSPIQDVKGLQKVYNRIFSRQAEHLLRLPAGWLMVPITSGIPKRAFTSDTGTVIRYSPGGGKPEFVFPPFQGLAWYDRFLQRVESSMEERMALPPAVRGQMPRGARAARTVELLQEAADAVQAPVLADIADGWTEFYEKTLSLMHKRFSVVRLIRMLGEDKTAEALEFKGDMIPRDWQDRLRVYVEQGESLPSTRMMRIELILTMAQRHLVFGQPGTPAYTKALLKALNLDAGFIPQEDDVDISIAENENYAILADANPPVRDIDNDVAHLQSHVAFMKRLYLLGRDDEAAKFVPHVEATKQALLKKIQPVKAPPKPPGGPQKPGGPGGPPQPGQQPPVAQPGGQQPQAQSIEPIGDQVLGGAPA